MTKNGPLLLPSSSVLKVAAPEVSIEVYTNWGEDFILESMGKGRLAADIAMSPTIPGWEARRTKANDVYFINSEKGQSTACLWREIVPSNDDTSMKITPIPEGWTIAKVNGRVLYRSPGSKLKETPPEPDGKSTYEKVIKSKEYCQLLEFFPQYLIDQYEKDAKPPEPAPFIPRYLRLPPAVR